MSASHITVSRQGDASTHILPLGNVVWNDQYAAQERKSQTSNGPQKASQFYELFYIGFLPVFPDMFLQFLLHVI